MTAHFTAFLEELDMIHPHDFATLSLSARSAIRRIDHVTYVTGPANESAFIASWNALGFKELNRLHTRRYPASHIVLANEDAGSDAWGTMTGLSVSNDAKSPINEFVRRYGTGIQHVAYAIHPEIDMDRLFANLKANQWRFITPLMDHVDGNQARLRQAFVAPALPYGPFVELVQRLPGVDGKVFDNFDVVNIDNLYAGYDAFSRRLLKQANRRPETIGARTRPASRQSGATVPGSLRRA